MFEWHPETSANSQKHFFIRQVILQLTVTCYFSKSASRVMPLSFNAESPGISVCLNNIYMLLETLIYLSSISTPPSDSYCVPSLRGPSSNVLPRHTLYQYSTQNTSERIWWC